MQVALLITLATIYCWTVEAVPSFPRDRPPVFWIKRGVLSRKSPRVTASITDWVLPSPQIRSLQSVCIPRNSSELEYAKHVLREGEIPLYPADMDVEVSDMDVEHRTRRTHPQPLLRHRRDSVPCTRASDQASAPIAHRSLCPWQWIVGVDRTRIPSKMLEAKCLCPYRPVGMGYECEAVRVSQKVLKFDPTCDGYRYAEDVIQLGCVAVLSLVRKIDTKPNVSILTPAIET